MKKFFILTFSLLAVIIIWKIGLEALIYLVRTYLPISIQFPYYGDIITAIPPERAVWFHFDGIHYYNLARRGYWDIGPQAFFPLYPMIVGWLHRLGATLEFSGIFVSLSSLLIALFGITKLYPGKFSVHIISITLLFPTSFFFASSYTESIFLALSVWFFYCLKERKFWLAAFFASLASGTRLVGIFFSLALAYELYRAKQYKLLFLLLPLSLFGFMGYSFFLWQKYDDPFMFFHVQSMFGAGRTSSSLVLLPQVLFRYFKMIFTVDIHAFAYQRLWLELLTFLAAVFFWLKKIKISPPSQSLYLGLSLLLPTLTGTLSSMPRYVLVLVPFLIPLSVGKKSFIVYVILSTIMLIYTFSWFVRGYFIG